MCKHNKLISFSAKIFRVSVSGAKTEGEGLGQRTDLGCKSGLHVRKGNDSESFVRIATERPYTIKVQPLKSSRPPSSSFSPLQTH